MAVQFAADPAVTSKPVRVNLIANDKNVIPNLAVPVEAKLIHGPIRLMPPNGHLTQIIYTKKQKRYPLQWRWSSCQIRRIGRSNE